MSKIIKTEYMLRFDTEDHAKAVLAMFVNEDNKWNLASHEFAVDPIGPVVKSQATYDANMIEILPAVIDTRFHINVRAILDIDVSIYEVNPVNPSRVWA